MASPFFSSYQQVNGANTEAFQTIVSSFADTSSNLLKYVAYKVCTPPLPSGLLADFPIPQQQVDFVKDRSRVVCWPQHIYSP